MFCEISASQFFKSRLYYTIYVFFACFVLFFRLLMLVFLKFNLLGFFKIKYKYNDKHLKKILEVVAEQRRYDLWWPLNPWPWSLTDHCLPDLKSFSFMSKPVISTRLVEANVNVNLLLRTPYPPQRIFLSDRRNSSRAWGKLYVSDGSFD